MNSAELARVRGMQPSRTKVVVGAAVIALAVDMVADPPGYISWPLLAVGMLLLVWGLDPQRTIRAANSLPGGHHLVRLLVAFDEWFERTAVVATYDHAISQHLQQLLARGSELAKRHSGVGDRTKFFEDIRQWTAEVTQFLSTHLAQESFMFEVITPYNLSEWHAFTARLNKLRLIIGRYDRNRQ